jgi:S-formylglutathione hydrolase FrmB
VVTLALVAAVIATFVRLQRGLELPTARFVDGAFSVHAVTGGHYGVLVSSTLLTRDLFMVVSICVSLLVTMGSYEVAAGHTRAAVLAVFAAVAGPLSVAAELGLLAAGGSQWALTRMDTLDIGASAIVAASSGALAGIVRDRRLTVGLVLFLFGGLLVHHQLADWEHVSVFPWGLLAGRVFGRGPAPRRQSRRRLLAYAIAAALLGGIGVAASRGVLPPDRVYHSAGGAVVSAPQLLETTYPSPALHESRKVIVMLPAGYAHSTQRYPVVVLLHGDPGSPQGLLKLGDLQAAQSASGVGPFIGVLPDGNGPAVQRSWYVNTAEQQIGTSVAVDLRRWVAGTFRTNSSYSYAGLSSGGFGAAYLPLLDHQPVHAVCGLSGYYTGAAPPLGHDLGAQRAASALLHAKREPALVFLAYGNDDRRTKAQTARFADALRSAGKHVVLRTYPGKHTWSVWRPAFRACLRTIVP